MDGTADRRDQWQGRIPDTRRAGPRRGVTSPHLPLVIASAFTLMLAGCLVPQVTGVDTLKYFNTLDYGRPEVARQIPAYENDLWTAAERARTRLADPAATGRKGDAMALVYAAFYMANANYGAMNGAITRDELRRFRRFAPEAAPLETELAAREQAARRLLELAGRTLPDEPMITGYLASSHIRQEFDASGRTDQEYVERLVVAAERDPSFNLFSALIVLEDFPPRPDLRDRLFRLLDEMTSGKGPCDTAVLPARGCMPNLRIVPFAFQGSRVIAGDAYLERAIRRLASDANDSGGRSDLERALELYEKLFDDRLYFGGIHRITNGWRLKSTAEDRILMVRAALAGEPPSQTVFRSPAYKAVYQCASCHSH
jgi:hypothetical protein